jgi:hypothetical protein
VFVPSPADDDDVPVPGFGDNVRVVATPHTEAAGYAGRAGSVMGETRPSSSGVEVLGGAADDYALAVRFDDTDEEVWFAPELLELVDHGEGMVITIDADPTRKWVRNAAGGWDEIRIDPPRRTWLQRVRGLLGG